jgi:hypothetical protein
MNKPTDHREVLMDEAEYAIARIASHYQEHIDYWMSRCLKAEDDLGDVEEKYQELVRGVKPLPYSVAHAIAAVTSSEERAND